MRRFKGFTLSELMVALAVIGIIVAIVTPAIMKTRPNKNKMMVKKTFYTVENIVSKLINDERLYPDMTDYCYLDDTDPDKDKCYWGFDYADAVEYEGETYEGREKFIKLFISNLNVKNAEEDLTIRKAIYYTNDGVRWDLGGLIDQDDCVWRARGDTAGVGDFDYAGHGTGVGKISIDVNGDEEPNAVCNADNEDCDQYEIQILANGKMRINPEHTRAVEYVSINTSIKD